MEEQIRISVGWQGIVRRISSCVSEGRKLNPDGGTPAFCYEPGRPQILSMEVRDLRVEEGVLQAYLTRRGEPYGSDGAVAGDGKDLGGRGWYTLDGRFLGLLVPTLESIEQSLERDRYWDRTPRK
jgi:hypothetical protein